MTAKTACCGAPAIDGLPPRGWPRCTGCGHRVPVGGVRPGQSRELPFWTWPGELIGRWLACMANSGPEPRPHEQLPICPDCGHPTAEDSRPGWRHICAQGQARRSRENQ